MIRYGPLLCIIILMISAALLMLTRREVKAHLVSGFVFLICAVMTAAAYFEFHGLGYEQRFLYHFFSETSLSLILSFAFFSVNFLIIWFSSYAIDKYIEKTEVNLYFGMVLMLNAFVTTILFSDDMRIIYVAYVFVILMSYKLIKIKNKVAVPYEKTKYIVLNLFGLLLLASGLVMFYKLTGIASIRQMRHYLDYSQVNYMTLSLTLCVIGLGVGGALFPFYSWLPDLYASTPAPLSAQLSSVTIKVAPIIMMRIAYEGLGLIWFSNLKMDLVLIILGILSMLSGSAFAILQRDIKKMLAYSTIAQLGYIYLAIGLSNYWGIRIAIYQILAHLLTKSAVYLSVSSLYEQTGTTEIDELRGVGREMPATLCCFSLGALSMVGIPLLPGFITKWYLSLSAIANGMVLPVVVILISSIFNAAYYLPIIINGFYGKGNLSGKVAFSKAKPLGEMIPLMILVTAMVLFGVFSNVYFSHNPVGYFY